MIVISPTPGPTQRTHCECRSFVPHASDMRVRTQYYGTKAASKKEGQNKPSGPAPCGADTGGTSRFTLSGQDVAFILYTPLACLAAWSDQDLGVHDWA
jgi:hypothetical protein